MVKWVHIQEQLGLKNLPALTNKYDEECKKCRYELNESEKQSHRAISYKCNKRCI